MSIYKSVLLLLMVGWSLLFIALAFNFHAAMRTNRSDLGQIDQAIWNSSQGRWLENTDAGFVATRLTDHVEPILVLISPIFWLWNDVRALLVLQVVFVAVGAWLILSIADFRFRISGLQQEQNDGQSAIRDPRSAIPLAFALAYLFAPQLQHAVMTEFHAAPLAVPLILWALWAVERRRIRQFVIATLLVAAVKEEMAITAAGLGVWAVYRITRYELRVTKFNTAKSTLLRHLVTLSPCLLVTFASLAWFIIATFIIVPANAPLVYQQSQSVYFQRFGVLGDTPVSIVKTLFSNPGLVWSVLSQPARLAYLRGLLAPFGFLSLLAPELLIVALPLIVANLFSTYPGQYYNEFHYSAPIIPFVAVSAIFGAQRLLRITNRSISNLEQKHSQSAITLLLTLWLLGWSTHEYLAYGRGPGGGRYDPIVVTDHHRLLEHFVAQIPVDAAVTATSAVQPHLSHRRYIYQFPLGLDSPVPATWALLDVTSKTDLAPGDLKAQVDTMLAGGWGVVDGANGFLLLRAGASEKKIPDAFYSFVLGGEAAASSEPGQAVVQVADWARWRETNVVYQAPASLAAQGFRILTPAADEVYNNAALPTPAQLWFPARRWPADSMIRLTTLALYLPRTWGVVDQSGLVASYVRSDGKMLVELPTDLFTHAQLAEELTATTGWSLRSNQAALRAGTSSLQVQSWLRDRQSWPGETLDLWLQWRGTAWPAKWTVFIHLRNGSGNVTQADGTPRWFLPVDASAALTEYGLVNDWRQLTVPVDTQIGQTLTVVIGLYEPMSGQRAEFVDEAGTVIGNEFAVGSVGIGQPPVPDQTCAMIAQSCVAQQ
ncbi:MAG: DUF2079 domain-containing protein [Caldilineaceae bacterium]